MTRRRPVGDLTIAIITIFAIAGTLSGCGRYGSPVRVAPAADSAAEASQDEASSADAEDGSEELNPSR